jgi:hypothetical protein
VGRPLHSNSCGRPGSFFLADDEGKTTIHTWNISNLYKFYIYDIVKAASTKAISEGQLTLSFFRFTQSRLFFSSFFDNFTGMYSFLTRGTPCGGVVFNEAEPVYKIL